MALIDTTTFESCSNLSLWFKVYTGESLNLSDVPEIIPIRWTYFRDNWQLLRKRLLNNAEKALDPDYFRATILELSSFIERQRADNTDTNPFSSNSIYFRFYPVFDNIRLESITLTNEERSIVAKKKAIVGIYSKVDFLDIKKSLRSFRDVIADQVGLSDPTYNSIYNRSPIVAQTTPSLSDLSLMKVIEKQLQTVDFVLANLFAVDTAIDPFALARINANNPNIDIRQYGSGKMVKLNFQEDLPSLAKRYFGSADRWIDIAIANGLKEPYVDEVGQQIFLLTNGNGNQINISPQDQGGIDAANRFFVNQLVQIQSDVYPYPSQRLITNIKQVPLSGEIILTLSGESNLGLYLLSNRANIRVFKPNTVNSYQYILIPSPDPLPNARVEEIPWFLASKGADEKNTKVDIALGEKGEILRTSNGDIALSYGIDNAVQAIRAKMQTELGANRRHPNLGLVNIVGVSTTISAQAKTLLVNSIVGQIQADSRFDRVQSVSVERDMSAKGGITYFIELVVKLTGSETFVPITFTVNS